jgi:hypothetical protein
MHQWVVDELRTADLGDQRLNQRLALLLDRFSCRPTASLPAACQGRNELEAAYRFFDNPKADYHAVLAPHRDATLARIRQHQVVLLAQDTTEADLSRPPEKVGGPLGDDGRTGLFIHPLLAFTPDRLPLGTVHVEVWPRDPDDSARCAAQKAAQRKRLPIDAKESRRWLEGYRQAGAVAPECPDTQVICLCDSEGDVYEALLQTRPQPGQVKAGLIVRACQDRCLDGAAGGPRLFAAVADAPALTGLTVRLSRRVAPPSETRKRKQARPARQATVTVRAARVSLRGPARPGGRLESLEVNAVLAREDDPPVGEGPVEWLLLSDLPIGTLEEVLAVLAYYCVRWQAEVFFGVLKGGCRVEERQLETVERFQACLAVYLIVAWRVLVVTMLGRQQPQAACAVVFEEDEWRAAYTVVNGAAPEQAPPLAEMIEVVARLGGYAGRRQDGPPGPKVMWLGRQRLRDFAACWRAFGPGQGNHEHRPKSSIYVGR